MNSSKATNKISTMVWIARCSLTLSLIAWITSFFVTNPMSLLFSTSGYFLNLLVSIILSASSSFMSGVIKTTGEAIISLRGSFSLGFPLDKCLTISNSVTIPMGVSPSTTTMQPLSVLERSLAASSNFSSFFNVGTSASIIFLTLAIGFVCGLVI